MPEISNQGVGRPKIAVFCASFFLFTLTNTNLEEVKGCGTVVVVNWQIFHFYDLWSVIFYDFRSYLQYHQMNRSYLQYKCTIFIFLKIGRLKLISPFLLTSITLTLSVRHISILIWRSYFLFTMGVKLQSVHSKIFWIFRYSDVSMYKS